MHKSNGNGTKKQSEDKSTVIIPNVTLEQVARIILLLNEVIPDVEITVEPVKPR